MSYRGIDILCFSHWSSVNVCVCVSQWTVLVPVSRLHSLVLGPVAENNRGTQRQQAKRQTLNGSVPTAGDIFYVRGAVPLKLINAVSLPLPRKKCYTQNKSSQRHAVINADYALLLKIVAVCPTLNHSNRLISQICLE